MPPGRERRMIVRARVVVTMDGAPIENGAVAITGNRIVEVGKFSDVSVRNSGETVDLGEQALLPGLINSHCHLDYTCLRGKIAAPNSFTDWIHAINAEKGNLKPENYVASIKKGFSEAKKFGTTTIANLTAFPELISKIESPVRTWWFAELIDVRNPGHAKELVRAVVEYLQSSPHWGLAPHSPFTASADLLRQCEETAGEKVLLTIHLAESREEAEMFRDGKGRLYDFLKSIGRLMTDCGNKTPVEKFISETRRRDWMLVHLNEIAETDFDLLTQSKSEMSVVHCPRSHRYFGHSPFQMDRLRRLGLNVCLGTDSLASNDDLSLFAEMRQVQRTFPETPPEKILAMVTVNGALALRQQRTLGRIQPGLLADLVAVPCAGSADPLEEIIAFDGPVAWSMIDGEAQTPAQENSRKPLFFSQK